MLSNQPFLIFFVTILIVRIFVFLKPIPSPTIKGFRTHHYMYGIILILAGIIFNSMIVYAIGLGLFVDELTYILIGGKTHKDNYSKTSLFGTLLFTILVFIFRGPLF